MSNTDQAQGSHQERDQGQVQGTVQAIPTLGSLAAFEGQGAIDWKTLPQFRIDHPLHKVLAFFIIITSCCLMWWTRNNEWGVFWTIWIPCWLSFIPACILLRYRCVRIAREHGALFVISGWRTGKLRALVDLSEVELGHIPMAGLAGVVLRLQADVFAQHLEADTAANPEAHNESNATPPRPPEIAIATWISPGKANRLATWIDEQYQHVPRFEFTPQQWDK